MAATDPLYILYTSGTTGKPKGVVRDNGGHAVALRWSLPNVYDTHPGEVFWAASDVGWVVGHSYIVYAPLLTGCTTILYEGKPVGTPDPGAFWRVVADHGVKTLFTAPTAFRAIKKEDPSGSHLAGHDLSSFSYLFLAGERTRSRHLPLGRRTSCERPVIDHWWQTETGWPIVADCLGIEHLPVKPGSPTKPVPGYRVKILDPASGEEVPDGVEGAVAIELPLPPGCLPTLWHDDERFVRSYLTTFPGHYVSGDGGYRDERRLPVRDGPHRRRDQRGRAPPVDGRHGGGHRHPSRRGRVRRRRRGRRAQGAGAGRVRRAEGGRRARSPTELQAELVTMVRDRIGAVAAFKEALVVARLPEDTLRARSCAPRCGPSPTGGTYNVPSTIDDPVILDEIGAALKER